MYSIHDLITTQCQNDLNGEIRLMMKTQSQTFGQALRERRQECGHTLRKFAVMVGVSPTYLSQVEQDNADPPTAERIERMAELLDVNSDAWCGLAERLPTDLFDIIRRQPSELCQLTRIAGDLTNDQIAVLIERAKQLSQE
jgi:HTH-type transcriptional regulator, competence development regulator